MVLHSFIPVSCVLYLLCNLCLCDVLILTCFIFKCQLTDIGFMKHTHTHTHIYIYMCVCVCVCVYVCINLHIENAAAGSSEMSITIRLHGVTSQKTVFLLKNFKSYFCKKYNFDVELHL